MSYATEIILHRPDVESETGMKDRAKLGFSTIVSCTAFWICSLAFAADEPDTVKSVAVANGGPPALEEVIVTAERRSQPLHKVPVSIAALTGEDIEQSKIGSIVDVQQHVPGLT